MDQSQSEIPSEIKIYLENLLQDGGITTLDQETKEETIKELYARLDVFMASAIVENLLPEHIDNFIKINEEKKNKDEIEKFLKEKMPNYTEIFAKAFTDFRAQYLGGVAAYRNAPKDN